MSAAEKLSNLRRRERHRVTELFKAMDMVVLNPFAIPLVKIICTQVLVGFLRSKETWPSLPRLMALLEQHGHLRLTEEERRQQLAMSVSGIQQGFVKIWAICSQVSSHLHEQFRSLPA